MSKNVVDACIEYAGAHDVGLILIPSRRQVEHNGGYSNGWTTKALAQYVRAQEKKRLVLIQRDHGGPAQGETMDDGLESLSIDCKHLNLIHLDPWKVATSFQDGCHRTVALLRHCYEQKPSIGFEVGTEEAIYPFKPEQLYDLLAHLQRALKAYEWRQIRYAVIQCGTALKDNVNIGQFDELRLKRMVEVCVHFGLESKEHNGDFLPAAAIRRRFQLKVDCINLAPEFGQLETQAYLDAIGGNEELFETFYQICHSSNRWVKWLDPTKPIDKGELIKACGHYMLSQPAFLDGIKARLPNDLDTVIKAAIMKRLDELYALTHD